MSDFALKVVRDDEDHARYRWMIVEEDDQHHGQHHVHQLSECHFDVWADALNAGTLALAAAAGQPYENEAADPVAESGCATDKLASELAAPGSSSGVPVE